MPTNIPPSSQVMNSLLRADFTTQWRNRRSFILVLIVPVIILISWKGVVDKMGGAFALGSCITVGLTAIGLMGYSNSIARDRDKGVFQRLRVSPIPGWSIMASRILIQLVMILLMVTAVFAGGHYFDGINLKPSGYILGYLSSLVGGAVYLGLGQAIVGRIKNAETVNSVSRLIYFLFIMIGMFGELGILGKEVAEISKWSPYGTVKTILFASMQPASWDSHAYMALLATIGYAVLFCFLGIRWFRWNSR
jgi:ABC-2 type transport system permease protein